VEGFVNYRTWPLIGAAEFKAYHRAVGPRVIAFGVVPIALLVVVTAGLLWWRPQAIPASLTNPAEGAGGLGRDRAYPY
jgi:hypothetical protein